MKRNAIPRAVMVLDADQASGVVVLDSARLIRVYDPTLDIDAKPVYLSPESLQGFVPLPAWLRIDRASMLTGVDYDWDEPHNIDVQPKDLRVMLDGRPVCGAFEASRRDGWVRFLDHRPVERAWLVSENRWTDENDTAPYAHCGPDGEPSGYGAVTGIAFGRVEWMIDESALTRTEPAVAVDG